MTAGWWLGAAIVGVAAIVNGVAGFAFGILSMSLLTLLWEPSRAVVVVTLLATYACLAALFSIRRFARWDCLLLLLTGFFVGLPAGTAMITTPGTDNLLRLLLASACLIVARQNWTDRRPEPEAAPPPRWQGLLAGVLSGFMSSSISSGGPPILWYIYRRPWSRDELKATCLMIFTVSNLTKLTFWGLHDLQAAPAARLYQPDRLWLALSYLPAAMFGSAVGVYLFRFVDRRQLRRIVCLLLILLATMLVARVLRSA